MNAVVRSDNQDQCGGNNRGNCYSFENQDKLQVSAQKLLYMQENGFVHLCIEFAQVILTTKMNDIIFQQANQGVLSYVLCIAIHFSFDMNSKKSQSVLLCTEIDDHLT